MNIGELSCGAGKYLSEALIFASINPQYDNILFMELPVQYKRRTWAEQPAAVRVKRSRKNRTLNGNSGFNAFFFVLFASIIASKMLAKFSK